MTEDQPGDVDMIESLLDQQTNSRSHATSIATKWRKRLFPRRQRRDINVKRSAEYILPALPPLSTRRRPINEDGVCPKMKRNISVRKLQRRVAKAPARQQTMYNVARTSAIERSLSSSSHLATRLRGGRTLENLWPLMTWNLFQRINGDDQNLTLMPRPGLFATIESTQPVFIIGAFRRYGVALP